MTTRADHKLEGEHLDLLDKLAAAKKSKDARKLDAVKAELYEFRQKWRGIRDYVAGSDGAQPAAVNVTTKKAGR